MPAFVRTSPASIEAFEKPVRWRDPSVARRFAGVFDQKSPACTAMARSASPASAVDPRRVCQR